MGAIDVTIRGAGVFGLSVAWACLGRGARVRVVETRRIGAGASGGVLGALAPHVPEGWDAVKRFQFESLVLSAGWWAAVAAAGGGDPGYARTGRLQPLADAGAVGRAEARAEGARRHWGAAATWRVVPAAGFPLAPASATGLVVEDTLSARLQPRRALAALAAALEAGGAEVIEGGVAEERGVVVHATGWEGLAQLSRALGRPVGDGVKGQALLLAPPPAADWRAAPQVFAGGLHVVPHADGTVAVGSTSEPDFDDPAATDEAGEALLGRAVAACPGLAGAGVLEGWAGVRPRAATRAPLLGAWPGRPGHFVANGGFKIGFGIAPKAAEAMADLVLEGRDAIPEEFRPGAAEAAGSRR